LYTTVFGITAPIQVRIKACSCFYHRYFSYFQIIQFYWPNRRNNLQTWTLSVICLFLESWQVDIFSPVLHSDNIPNRQRLQAFGHHSTHSAPEPSTVHSLHNRFTHQLIAGVSVEQNSIGRTQIILFVRTSNRYLKGWLKPQKIFRLSHGWPCDLRDLWEYQTRHRKHNKHIQHQLVLLI
jgi:hypothetical protein